MRAEPRRRRGRARAAHAHAWTLILAFVVASIAGVAIVTLGDGRIVLPRTLTDRIERRIDASATGVDLSVGQISVGVGDGIVPQLWVEQVRMRLPGGQTVAQLAEVGLTIDPMAALGGRIAPRTLTVEGATLTLRRDAEGRFELALGGGGRRIEGGLGGLLAAIDGAMDRPPYARASRVVLRDATVTVEDARSSRIWQLSDAGIVLRRRGRDLELSMSADIFNGTDALGRLDADVTMRGSDGRATAQIALDGIQSGDISLQSPALAFLGVLDAPLSGAIRAEVSGDGVLRDLAGTLEIGAGTLAPRAGTDPIEFDRAKAYFTFDPERSRLDFSQISARGALGNGRLSGHAYLSDTGPDGFPRALLAQLNVEEVALDAPAHFAAPLRIGDGQIDMRVRVDPFAVEIGQVSLPGIGGAQDRDLHLSGRAAPGPEGWNMAVDAQASEVGIDALLRLWPLSVAPKARTWLAENVIAGTAEDAVAALRFAPGDEKPRLNVTFGYRDAKVRVMKGVPPVVHGAGIGSLIDHRLAIEVERASMPVEDRGVLDLAGSTFVIPDGRIKPNPAEIDIAAKGPLAALLGVLDAPRFALLTKAGRDADLATGEIEGSARIALVLRKGNTPEDIDLTADATITDLFSDRIVQGRDLRSERMRIAFADWTLSGEGPATLDGVGFDGTWRQTLLGPGRGRGSVSGRVALDPDALEAFGVTLPAGLVSGRGAGRIDVTLAAGAPPRLTLSSDLRGIGLSIPAVNWSKPPGREGALDVSVVLEETPQVDALSLDAPGLSARGRVRLEPGPRFAALELERVRLGGWLDGAVTIRSQGAGSPPAIAVRGGEIDIRRVDLGQGAGGSGARGPVSLRLDRLRVTDTVALHAFAMDLAAGRDLSGKFQGRVNGGVAVSGVLSGTAEGAAIRIRSDDAGAVLRDSGLFENVAGGTLDLTLRPAGGRGIYDGRVTVAGPRLLDAPAMAKLVSAISGVGLIDQMRGRGIPFDDVRADFRLSPGRLTLYRSSAVGNALGLSMDGVFDPQTKRMDMQGVISPIYLLNRVGSVFTRRGEGLFGVNFTLRGPVSDPAVGVNPLSILTPGLFRDIFRRPPPTRTN